MPGDNVELVCDLVHNVAAEVGTRFTLREGGKTGEYVLYCVVLFLLTFYSSRYRHRYKNSGIMVTIAGNYHIYYDLDLLMYHSH